MSSPRWLNAVLALLRPLGGVMICAAAGAALAQSTPSSSSAELQSRQAALQGQRRALDERLKREEAECATRFAVSGCVVSARERHRDEKRQLDKELFAVNQQLRNQAQIERTAERAKRRADHQQRLKASEANVPQYQAKQQRISARQRAQAERLQRPAAPPKAPPTAPDAAAVQAKERATAAKSADVEATRKRIGERRTEPGKPVKSAKPLPLDPAAAPPLPPALPQQAPQGPPPAQTK